MNKATTIQHTADYTANVDRLGELRAELKTLKNEAATIEAFLKREGAGRYDGDLFCATVTESQRTTVDWKAVAAKLEPSRQLVSAHTSTTDVITLRLSAHAKEAA